MEIVTQQQGEFLEVRLDGRLDAYWADHLSRSLEDAITTGGHRIQVRMSEVSYMSSVGLRVLVKFYKQLDSIGGSLRVTEPAGPVLSVLKMAGLETLLGASSRASEPDATRAAPKRIETEEAIYDIHALASPAEHRALSCRVVGSAHRLADSGFCEGDCRNVALPPTTFAVGLGAFGADFSDCRSRFGELVAVAGAAAYLPTDGTNAPDYLLSTGSFVPEISLLYALVCDGQFQSLLRFEERTTSDPVPLSKIVEQALEASGADHAGVVIVAESGGLIGAALRRSPAAESAGGAMFEHPGIREWLSFSAEACHRHELAVIVGVASRAPHALLDPLLRPLGNRTTAGASAPWPAGHFHAAIFPNRPLAKGSLDLAKTVASLFENEMLRSVLHLLADDRAGVGAGQSELVRGACWVSPIVSIEAAS
jgi:anti-anti-sigma factor